MRRALVLGSSSGLGRAVAAALAAEGTAVAVVSRDTSGPRKPAERSAGAAALAGDLTVPGEPARLVAEAVAALGGLDICVVNTGGGKPGGILATSEDDVDGCLSLDAAPGPRRRPGRRPAPRRRRSRPARVPDGPQRRRGVARPRSVVGDAQWRRRRRSLACHRVGARTCSSTSSSPASSTRRR